MKQFTNFLDLIAEAYGDDMLKNDIAINEEISKNMDTIFNCIYYLRDCAIFSDTPTNYMTTIKFICRTMRIDKFFYKYIYRLNKVFRMNLTNRCRYLVLSGWVIFAIDLFCDKISVNVFEFATDDNHQSRLKKIMPIFSNIGISMK